MRKFETMTDKQLADEISDKTAKADSERSGAALRGMPAKLVTAKQLEKQVAELQTEQSKRTSNG